MHREAFAIVYERAKGRTAEAIVDLAARSVRSWRELSDVQPGFMSEDYEALLQAVRGNPEWQAAVRKRGHHGLRTRANRSVGRRLLRLP
jgi:primary-amine oxidase